MNAFLSRLLNFLLNFDNFDPIRFNLKILQHFFPFLFVLSSNSLTFAARAITKQLGGDMWFAGKKITNWMLFFHFLLPGHRISTKFYPLVTVHFCYCY